MELKSTIRKHTIAAMTGFNRTFMELKYAIAFFASNCQEAF